MKYFVILSILLLTLTSASQTAYCAEDTKRMSIGATYLASYDGYGATGNGPAVQLDYAIDSSLNMPINFRLDHATQAGTYKGGIWNGSITGASAILRWPLNERWSPYAGLGIAYVSLSGPTVIYGVSGGAITLATVLGLNYAFNKEIYVDGQLVSLVAAQAIGIGLHYRF